MRKTVQELVKDNGLKIKLQQEGLKWTFNPPAAPLMEGVWEAMGPLLN